MVVGPEALVDAIPPRVAFAPGSTLQWWSQDCYNDPGCQRIDDGLANIDLQGLSPLFQSILEQTQL